MAAAAFGYLISSTVNQVEMAVTIAPLVALPQILFGGFFANTKSYPDWITWL
jgi:ATP-binding cassette subfamily G (WHITE) protein 1